MKILKRTKQASPKKILIVAGLVVTLGYLLWPTLGDSDFAAGETESEAAESADVPSTNGDNLKTSPASTIGVLPPVDIGFVTTNNPFLSSAARNQQRNSELAQTPPESKSSSAFQAPANSTAKSSSAKVTDRLLAALKNMLSHDKLKREKHVRLAEKRSTISEESDLANPETGESDSAGQSSQPPALKIQAIVTSHRRPAALINDRIYYESDPLNSDWQVKSILPDRVLLAPILDQLP